MNSQVLEKFTHLVKEHHRHRRRVFPNQERTDGGQAHQEVFVKHMAFYNVFHSAQHHIIAQHHICGNI